MNIRFGTRGSKLALFQTRWIISRITAACPGLQAEEVVIQTLGDKVKDVPLFQVGGQGLFIKEIETALTTGQVDLAVHSLKDVPHKLADGLVLGAITEREDPRDVLLTRNGGKLEQLPHGSCIGTSSLRRQAQLAAFRGDLKFVDLRGNLDTRLRKLADGEVEAIILAAAGLHRLGWADRITQYLPIRRMIPAAGQGLLGIECRAADLERLKPFLAAVSDEMGTLAAAAERAFLAGLQGGCQTPLAAHAIVKPRVIRLQAFIGDPSGKEFLHFNESRKHDQAAQLGTDAAQALIDQGARRFLPAHAR